MKGQHLHDRILAVAAERGVKPSAIIARFNRDPSQFMKRIVLRAKVREKTIADVEDAIAKTPFRIAGDAAQAQRAVYREPCPYCAVRADIGCHHSRRNVA